MSQPTIRPMRADEVERVSAVIVASIRAGMPGHYPAAVIDALAAGNSPEAVAGHAPKQADYVCEQSGRIVGMIGLKRNEIGHLFVEPASASRGVGRALVQFAAEQFRQAGYGEMVVLSSLNAVGFYERCGFAAEGGGSFPVGENLPLEYIKMRARL